MIPALPGLRARLSGHRGVLVDSSVLIDISSINQKWHNWSVLAVAEVTEYAPLVINPIIYAEVSGGYSSLAEADAALPVAEYKREALPWDAAFLAGKCFVQYRRRGGLRTSPLPDFYIGAHALVDRLALLTRDVNRYRGYFPKLEVLAPTHHM